MNGYVTEDGDTACSQIILSNLVRENDDVGYGNKAAQRNNLRTGPVATLRGRETDSSAACASSAAPTADESSHSAAGTIHPHLTATFCLYITLTLYCCRPV